jgi:hypothetical protein
MDSIEGLMVSGLELSETVVLERAGRRAEASGRRVDQHITSD